MKYQVLNTSEWAYEKLAKYGAAITAAMNKLADKFPQDVTAKSLAHECMTGARQLWVILDENDEFVSFCVTQTRVNDATNTKVVTLTSHAGAEGLDCVDDMCATIHEWAKEQGADYTAAEGRRGWGKALSKHGYREYATIYRRKIERAA